MGVCGVGVEVGVVYTAGGGRRGELQMELSRMSGEDVLNDGLVGETVVE